MLGLFTLGSRIQLILGAIVILTGVYFYWKNSVEQAALMEYNQKQLEQIIKDNEAFQQKMQEVADKQKVIQEDMNRQNDEINTKLKNIDDYLNSAEAKKQDKPSSVILKNTVGQIKGQGK